MIYVLFNGYYIRLELAFQDDPVYSVKNRGKDC